MPGRRPERLCPKRETVHCSAVYCTPPPTFSATEHTPQAMGPAPTSQVGISQHAALVSVLSTFHHRRCLSLSLTTISFRCLYIVLYAWASLRSTPGLLPSNDAPCPPR